MKIGTFILIILAPSLADHFLQSNIKFSSTVYKELLKIKSGNFMVCPLSAQIGMSLLSLGARGKTAMELVTALSLPQNSTEISSTFNKLLSNIEVTEPYELITANKIYLAENLTIKKDYKEIAVNIYKSDIETINFENSEQSTKVINSWVESKTRNKIKDLVQKSSLTPQTVAVLVNTLYFHGYWLNEFGKADGFKVPFYVSPTETVEVETFGGRNDFNYYDNLELKAKFLEMPFVGNEVTMTYVLPNEKDGLSQLETSISKVLTEDRYEKCDMEVTLPKFKMETDVNLKTILKSVGVHEAFEPSADFKGISEADIVISKVLQKTFIEVNERGATAASATQSYGTILSGPDVIFTANHPHIFFLKHRSHGVLFVGRYISP